MPLGGRACGRIRARPRRGRREGVCDLGLVVRVDEHSGLGCDELRRPAHARGDDRTAAGHRLEQRLPEGLDEARLADDMALGDQRRDAVVRHRSQQADTVTAFELATERPVS
ncbi:MAG TPA: hypothetical protein VGJ58_10025, partial [Gaiellaceae bacterium]